MDRLEQMLLAMGVMEIALVAVLGARMPVTHWNYPRLHEDEQQWVYDAWMRQERKHVKVAAIVEQAQVVRVTPLPWDISRTRRDRKSIRR